MYSNTRLVDVLTKIDHEKGVVSIISSYVIDYRIITSLISRLLLRHVTHVITSISTLLMWEGRPIKVVVHPTRIVESVRVITSLLGIDTNIVTVPATGGEALGAQGLSTRPSGLVQPVGTRSGAEFARRVALPI